MKTGSSYWTEKKVTVTGGSGFLGSHLVEGLVALGAEVQVPRSARYDLTVRENATAMFAGFNPDVLFHLAATVGGIGANSENPGLFFYENMTMGVNVIESARQYGRLERLVLIGTTCSYPNVTPVPFKESDLWNGYPEQTNAPYGVAKRALITMAQAYREQYGLNTVSLLPANLYGPRDNFDLSTGHVIPALIRKFVSARDEHRPDVVVWGSGRVSREFLYVGDAVDALLRAGELYDAAEPVNIGTGQETTIADLVEVLADEVGYDGSMEWDASKPDGQPRRCLDTSRAAALLGFEAKTSLRAGLRTTIDWFEQNSDRLN